MLLLTVMGLGSKIRAINFLALKESHGGQVNSAAEICGSRNGSNKRKTMGRKKNLYNNVHMVVTHFFIQFHKIWVVERQVTRNQYKENHST